MKLNKRGSYFFVLDVFIAASLLLLTLVIIISTRANAPLTDQPYFLAEDFMLFISTTEIRDLVNPLRNDFIEDGNITNTENTIVQQLAHMHYETNLLPPGQERRLRYMASWDFAKSITEGVIPPQFGVAYYYGDTLMYNRSNDTLAKADLVISSKKITYVRIDRTTIIGPNITEVIIWT